MIAESKGTDITSAVKQLENSASGLFDKEVGANASNTDLRIYTSQNNLAEMTNASSEATKFGGYSVRDGYLGYYNESREWLYEQVKGVRVQVVAAP